MLLFSEFILFRFILPASEWPYRYSIRNGNDAVRYIYKDDPMYHTGIQRLGFPERYAAKYNINHEGWNSTQEYATTKSSRKRIAIIGDSFVDALQVDVDKCFAELLQRSLGSSVEVYRFGFGAAGLSQYLQVLRYVENKFHPDIVIISMQANDFLSSLYSTANENDFLQLRQSGDRWIEIKPTAYKPSRLRLAVKHSAVFRYFYGNLNFRYRVGMLNTLFKSREQEEQQYRMNVEIQPNLDYLDTSAKICRYVFGQMKLASGPHQKLLVFMDTDRAAIYEGVDPKTEKLYLLTKIGIDTASEFGIPFIDLTDDFQKDYKLHHQRFDFDIDYHWNERGHRIVAKSLTSFLKTQKWCD